jgi:hypothetical protein
MQKGFAGALRVLQQQPYGAAWLGVLAAGLIAFGLHGLAEVAYRRITPPLHRGPSPRSTDAFRLILTIADTAQSRDASCAAAWVRPTLMLPEQSKRVLHPAE